MPVYKIVVEGHSNAGGDYPDTFLGECEANSEDEAIKNYSIIDSDLHYNQYNKWRYKNYHKPIRAVLKPCKEQTRELAYKKWLKADCPEGYDKEFWTKAEMELCGFSYWFCIGDKFI